MLQPDPFRNSTIGTDTCRQSFAMCAEFYGRSWTTDPRRRIGSVAADRILEILGIRTGRDWFSGPKSTPPHPSLPYCTVHRVISAPTLKTWFSLDLLLNRSEPQDVFFYTATRYRKGPSISNVAQPPSTTKIKFQDGLMSPMRLATGPPLLLPSLRRHRAGCQYGVHGAASAPSRPAGGVSGECASFTPPLLGQYPRGLLQRARRRKAWSRPDLHCRPSSRQKVLTGLFS